MWTQCFISAIFIALMCKGQPTAHFPGSITYIIEILSDIEEVFHCIAFQLHVRTIILHGDFEQK